jgi:KipI family sensor histidine kinase inhibitor
MGGRVRTAGDAGLLLPFGSTINAASNARALGVAEAFRRRRFPGVRDVIATYHSVAVYFDPRISKRDLLETALDDLGAVVEPYAGGALIEVPVAYGGESGPDLEAVAAFAGLPPREVIERHTSAEYRVFMLGFMPGFPYMGVVDARIAAPRRPTPRVRVEEGSVGVAGAQTGIYPCASPGGWQIIGRTSLRLFDAARARPALFGPGDRVRFNATARLDPPSSASRSDEDTPGPPSITVVRPGLFTTVQDEGRWGYQSLGVPVAGAMDAASLRAANAAVGNDRTAAALEVTLLGPELRFERSCVTAIAGADLSPTLDGRSVPLRGAFTCAAGTTLRFGTRRSGGRAYVAVRGGIAVPSVLGSRSTHARAAMGGLGGRALRAGDRLIVADASSASARADDVAESNTPADTGFAPSAPRTLRLLRGPQDDWFDEEAFARIESTRFTVQPDSDRMGFRLAGSAPVPRRSDEEMVSDAAFTGGIQIPPSGQPILLMADRPTTGGYPQIGVVIAADLSQAGQLVPGDAVRFSFCSSSEAQSALARGEGSRPA